MRVGGFRALGSREGVNLGVRGVGFKVSGSGFIVEFLSSLKYGVGGGGGGGGGGRGVV